MVKTGKKKGQAIHKQNIRGKIEKKISIIGKTGYKMGKNSLATTGKTDIEQHLLQSESVDNCPVGKLSIAVIENRCE